MKKRIFIITIILMFALALPTFATSQDVVVTNTELVTMSDNVQILADSVEIYTQKLDYLIYLLYAVLGLHILEMVKKGR